MKRLVALTLAAPVALAACNFSTERTDKQAQNEAQTQLAKADAPNITPVDSETIRAEGVVANGIVIADLDAIELGPKIVGPVGPEVEASLATPLAAIGDLSSWVVCPPRLTAGEGEKGVKIERCEPGNMAPGTVYTYVHAVTPGVDRPNDRPFAQPEAVTMPAAIQAFRVTVPLAGFTGKAGYSFGDATRALGKDGAISVACLQQAIVYAITAPKGGWRKGQTIRFFWQSTVPPAGPAAKYELAADGKRGIGAGPAPAQPENGDGPALNVPCG
ncbi:MAG: exosortase, PEP-CTERM interaction domain protein [Sphingomonadales bacterium]|nr:exosortase, PEP-CTERM interaction domain protein [Sphingomonadales bacterium]